MDKTDIAILNTTDNEDLNNYFENKEPGEPCAMMVMGKFLGMEEGNARISIEAVEIDSYEEEDDYEGDTEEMGMEMDEESPGVVLVLGAE